MKRDDLAALAAMAEAGDLRPALTTTYPLEEVGLALADLTAGRISGKAAVLPVPPA